MKATPRNPAWIPLRKCLTGKIWPVQSIQAGGGVERNQDPGQEQQRQDDHVDDRQRRSALGMTKETVNPSAQNAAAPIASMISIRRRVASVGVHGVERAAERGCVTATSRTDTSTARSIRAKLSVRALAGGRSRAASRLRGSARRAVSGRAAVRLGARSAGIRSDVDAVGYWPLVAWALVARWNAVASSLA